MLLRPWSQIFERERERHVSGAYVFYNDTNDINVISALPNRADIEDGLSDFRGL